MALEKNGELRELLGKAAAGDNAATSRIVEENFGLVLSIVKRFQNRGVERDDLIQIGSIGLVKAIRNFDTDYDVCFSTYAVPLIIGEIKRFLRDDGPIKVSRSLKELYNKARILQITMASENGREPQLSEIAARLDVTPQDLALAFESGQAPESFYKTVGDSDSSPVYLLDRLVGKLSGDLSEEYDDILNRMTITSLIQGLSEEEQEIIRLRYFEDCTQAQVGEKLGISQVQVSRKEKKALNYMRARLEEIT